MKSVTWILGLCLVTAGAPVVSAGEKPGSAKTREKKFDIPVWHPDARWGGEERYLGAGATGNLDGPADQVMSGTAPQGSVCFPWNSGGPFCFGSYDRETGLIHTIAGSARGYLDGPLSRARWGGYDYTHRGIALFSHDRKRYLFTDPYNGGVLRQIDLVNRTMTTRKDISLGKESRISISRDENGRVYVLNRRGMLRILSPDLKKVERTMQLEIVQKPGLSPWRLAVDVKKNRAYVGIAFTHPALWYVWYWDLKDGSFHGVIPVPKKGEPRRRKFAPGPFKGTVLYPEMSVYFGPDDPEKRYLYLGVNDCYTFFRADLEKQELWTFSRLKGGVAGFIRSGNPRVFSGRWAMGMLDNGDVTASVPSWEGGRRVRFRRIK